MVITAKILPPLYWKTCKIIAIAVTIILQWHFTTYHPFLEQLPWLHLQTSLRKRPLGHPSWSWQSGKSRRSRKGHESHQHEYYYTIEILEHLPSNEDCIQKIWCRPEFQFLEPVHQENWHLWSKPLELLPKKWNYICKYLYVLHTRHVSSHKSFP